MVRGQRGAQAAATGSPGPSWPHREQPLSQSLRAQIAPCWRSQPGQASPDGFITSAPAWECPHKTPSPTEVTAGHSPTGRAVAGTLLQRAGRQPSAQACRG